MPSDIKKLEICYLALLGADCIVAKGQQVLEQLISGERKDSGHIKGEMLIADLTLPALETFCGEEMGAVKRIIKSKERISKILEDILVYER